MLRTHTCGELTKRDLGKAVTLCGWVGTRRDHGGLIFIDLRDRYGITQLVFSPQRNTALHAKASELKPEVVLRVSGKVQERPKGTENPKLPTGSVEVEAAELEILNPCPTPPFEISDAAAVGDEVRLTYRFLDLRRPAMQHHLVFRYRVTKVVRDYLDAQGFLEVETPCLTRSTPEGARDYLVPARLSPGSFYALPQSPQLFKQLLMVAAFDRYFQIARCFRDEDLRADRQPEHTQIDMEMSFIEPSDIQGVVEGMLAAVFERLHGIKLSLPLKRLPYDEAMNRFGSDKPDLRLSLELVDCTPIFRVSRADIFRIPLQAGGAVKGMRVPGRGSAARSELEAWTRAVMELGAGGLAWFRVRSATELEGPIAKHVSPEEQKNLIKACGAQSGDLLLLVAADWHTACTSLGALRHLIGRELEPVEPRDFKLLWVVDFPLFERDATGAWQALHHPFTSPRPKDVPFLEKEPGVVRAQAYDLILNGTEIGGGSIRIHDAEVQRRVFQVLGIDAKQAQEKFGFLLEALRYGAPPHGGIALGLDRLCAELLGLSSIRDVIAFPKTQRGQCLLTDAPARVSDLQLKELHLAVSHGKNHSA